MMTTAFGADPVHDVKSGAIMAMLYVSFALIPASLLTFRWPSLGVAVSAIVAIYCAACIFFSELAILFLIMAASEAAIAHVVGIRSKESQGSLTIWTD